MFYVLYIVHYKYSIGDSNCSHFSIHTAYDTLFTIQCNNLVFYPYVQDVVLFYKATFRFI